MLPPELQITLTGCDFPEVETPTIIEMIEDMIKVLQTEPDQSQKIYAINGTVVIVEKYADEYDIQVCKRTHKGFATRTP